MRSSVGQSLAVSVAVCALAAVITGARVTSANTMPGLELGVWKTLHRALSTLSVVGAVAVAFSIQGALRQWLLGAVALAALPGGMLEAKVAVQAAGVLHAVAASILTSVTAIAALQLSSGWQTKTTPVVDEGSPSLAALARATWLGLLIQTALGALYRHQIVGLMAHVAGAMLVMGMVMYAGIAAFSTAGAPASVKRPALTLLIMTGVQMLFGLAAYLYRIQFMEQATGQFNMLTFTVIHVAVGALTTACSALMGMQISRYVRPAVVAS